MDLFLLACFLVTAMATTVVSSSQPEEQSAFRIQQGNTDYASSGTSPVSILTEVCEVELRGNNYDNHCKSAFVCRGGKYGNLKNCDITTADAISGKDFDDYQCDHIIDLQIITTILKSAGFCDAMDEIRKFDTTGALKENKYYIRGIRDVANGEDSVAYLDKEVHTVKTKIINFYLGKGRAPTPPVPIHKALLKLYRRLMFDDEYREDRYGPKVAKALDESVHEALRQMVEGIKDENQRRNAQTYLDGTTWGEDMFVSVSREAASIEWQGVETGWH